MYVKHHLNIFPDAVGSWSILHECSRYTVSQTHILFFSERKVVGFTILEIIQAICQRLPLRPSVVYDSVNILNAYLTSTYLLILGYSTQSPFLRIYNLNNDTIQSSEDIKIIHFTNESYSACLATPGTLDMYTNTIIFSFSRNSPIFTCDLHRINSPEAYFQIRHSGVFVLDKLQGNLSIFERNFVHTYSLTNLLRPMSKLDLNTFTLKDTPLKNVLLDSFIIERCSTRLLPGRMEAPDSIIIFLSNKQCFEVDLQSRTADLLNPALSHEDISSGKRTATERVEFYFLNSFNGKFTSHNLYFAPNNDISYASSMPTNIALKRFGPPLYNGEPPLGQGFSRQHNILSSFTTKSTKGILAMLVQNVIRDNSFNEALKACRHSLDKGAITRGTANILSCTIRKLSEDYLRSQGYPLLRAVEIEQEARKVLHKYANHKLREYQKLRKHKTVNQIYIVPDTEAAGKSRTLKSASKETDTQYISTRVCTYKEIQSATKGQKQADIDYPTREFVEDLHFRPDLVPCTHLLTQPPNTWCTTITMCVALTHGSGTLVVAQCQTDLYIYLV